MRKCIAKCLKGFDSCCMNCEMAVDSVEQRKAKRAKRTADKFRTLYIMGLVIILLITGSVLIIAGLFNEVMIQNTDILNTLQEA